MATWTGKSCTTLAFARLQCVWRLLTHLIELETIGVAAAAVNLAIMQMPVQPRTCRTPQAESLRSLPQHSPTACAGPSQVQPVGALRRRHRPFSAACRQRQSCAARPWHDRCHLSSRPARCTAQAAAVGSLADTAHALLSALEGTDRGIFGVPVRHAMHLAFAASRAA